MRKFRLRDKVQVFVTNPWEIDSRILVTVKIMKIRRHYDISIYYCVGSNKDKRVDVETWFNEKEIIEFSRKQTYGNTDR